MQLLLREEKSVSVVPFVPGKPLPIVASAAASSPGPSLPGSPTTAGAAPATPTPAGEDFTACDAVFSADGKLVAYASGTHVIIARVPEAAGGAAAAPTVVHSIAEEKVAFLRFSPTGTMLAAMSPPDPKRTDGNLAVFAVATGAVVLRVVQGAWPALIWSGDGAFCMRPALGLVAVHRGDLADPAPLDRFDLQLPRGKEVEIAAAPGEQPLVALFRPHNGKTTQASLMVSRLPALKDALFTVNYGRAEAATLVWNAPGDAVLVTVKMEADKSGASYYGTTTLHLVSVRERSSAPVALPAGDAIHDCQWSPQGHEFIAIHGAMPRNKATLFDRKGTAIYVFGEAPRNLVLWAPNGRLFALGGTGNLAGELQFYDRDAVGKRSDDGKLGFVNDKCSIFFWAPDSRHLVCATIFSRLRIDNRVVLVKHTGERVEEHKFRQLHGVAFVPQPAAAFPHRPPSPTKVSHEKQKPQAYRPPVASAAAAALLARDPATSFGQAAKPATGPVGATVVVQKKKKR